MTDPKTITAGQEPELTLRPARIDFLGPKTQMLIANLLAILTLFFVFGSTLSSGFLLDDFLHIDYIARAFQGDSANFLANFYSNWAGSDLMKSYRPLISLSLFIDYCIWGTNAWGFHLSNILLTASSAILLGLISMELSGLCGNRLSVSAAIWTALLFAVYPLHPEACTWIIGRVDLLCTAFYLASIFCYLRYKLIQEKSYFYCSLFFCVAALLSKEMAVTLPAVITLAEICLYSKNKSYPKEIEAKLKTQRITTVLSFWFVLGVVAGIRLLALSTLIGGYDNNAPIFQLSAFQNFLDKASIYKIFYSANEELQLASWLKPVLISAYLACLISSLARLIARSLNLRIIIFLLGWMIIGLLPTYQIWHIYPNLVGSRLFYLSSAPFVLLLSFLALPAIDRLPAVWAKLSTAVGVVALFCIVLCWSVILQSNLQPWIEAGKRIKTAQTDLYSLLTKNKDQNNDPILLLNLPTDYSGAGMLTRESYLQILCRPPFTDKDYSQRIRTIEPEVSGSHDFVWPDRFMQLYCLLAPNNTLIWDTNSGRFIKWKNDGGANHYEFHITNESRSLLKISPPNLELTDPTKWSLEQNNSSRIETGKNALNIHPGQGEISLFFPSQKLNPLTLNLAQFELFSKSANPEQTLGKIKLIWHETGKSDSSWNEALVRLDQNNKILWLGRYRNWTLARSIDGLGLKFLPGNYEVEFKSLSLANDKHSKPLLKLSQQCQLEYSLAENMKTDKILLMITSTNNTFDPNSEMELAELSPANSGKLQTVEISIHEQSGKLQIPPEFIASPGLHQIRIQALGSTNMSQGLASEPITVTVSKAGKLID